MDFLVEIAGSYVLYIMKDKTVSLWLRALLGSIVFIGYGFCVLGSGLMVFALLKDSLATSILLLFIFLYLIGSGISFCKKYRKEHNR